MEILEEDRKYINYPLAHEVWFLGLSRGRKTVISQKDLGRFCAIIMAVPYDIKKRFKDEGDFKFLDKIEGIGEKRKEMIECAITGYDTCNLGNSEVLPTPEELREISDILNSPSIESLVNHRKTSAY